MGRKRGARCGTSWDGDNRDKYPHSRTELDMPVEARCPICLTRGEIRFHQIRECPYRKKKDDDDSKKGGKKRGRESGQSSSGSQKKTKTSA